MPRPPGNGSGFWRNCRPLGASGPAALARPIGHAALACQGLKIGLLRIDILADILPSPLARQVMSRQEPDLDLLPRILGQEQPAFGQRFGGLLFEVVQSHAPALLAVAVDNEQEDVDHSAIEVQDFLDSLPLQRLGYSSQQRVLTDAAPWPGACRPRPASPRGWASGYIGPCGSPPG